MKDTDTVIEETSFQMEYNCRTKYQKLYEICHKTTNFLILFLSEKRDTATQKHRFMYVSMLLTLPTPLAAKDALM
jgi:hypothetical protein